MFSTFVWRRTFPCIRACNIIQNNLFNRPFDTSSWLTQIPLSGSYCTFNIDAINHHRRGRQRLNLLRLSTEIFTSPDSHKTTGHCNPSEAHRYYTHKGYVETPEFETPPEEWIHPDDRRDDLVSEDSELKGLLKELVNDFGVENSGKEDLSLEEEDVEQDDTAVGLEGGVVVKKRGSGGFQDGQPMRTIGKTKRGLPPVFSLDDISELLREENASDVCVIRVPPERGYVDHFIVVTARSPRHLIAMAESVNKTYKMRKSKKHPFVIIEGKNSEDWQCIDFGNIVVHFMLEEVRELYELEKLWLLGPEYDEQYQRLQRYHDALRQALIEDDPGSQEEGEESVGK